MSFGKVFVTPSTQAPQSNLRATGIVQRTIHSLQYIWKWHTCNCFAILIVASFWVSEGDFFIFQTAFGKLVYVFPTAGGADGMNLKISDLVIFLSFKLYRHK